MKTSGRTRKRIASTTNPQHDPRRESSDQNSIKLKLTIAYDGTNHQGWQAQKNGVTIQQRIEEALQSLFPSVARIHGSSRTDTGVHALGMAAHVTIPKSEFHMTVRKVPLALNAFLPDDIRIINASRVPIGFHARFDCQRKQYRYQIWNHRTANPLLRSFTWHVPVKLDLDRMRQAAQGFVGKHDFRSLAANQDYESEDTVRTLFRCDLQASGSLITIIMEGDGFLYKMCRAIVGTLHQVGRGKKSAEDIPQILNQRARQYAGMTAPAHGLTLYRVLYSPPKQRDRF
ncbi:MAG: tRNA pseudouridine synthase A [Verrucomicrobia subdivision 3 bacterium]|nr:tRNA pseudouridine synthase A [Limisphaerales bacterium]MCS1412789.1 tRNA pseudouridine synthase A [Limisphaerales bacterium]